MMQNNMLLAQIEQELQDVCSVEEFTIIIEWIKSFRNSEALSDVTPDVHLESNATSPKNDPNLTDDIITSSPTEKKSTFKVEPIVWDLQQSAPSKSDQKLPSSKRFKQNSSPLIASMKNEPNDSKKFNNVKENVVRYLPKDLGKRPRSNDNSREHFLIDSIDYTKRQKTENKDEKKSQSDKMSDFPSKNFKEFEKTNNTTIESSGNDLQVEIVSHFPKFSSYSYAPSSIPCKFFPNCLNPVCTFFHPAQTATQVAPKAIPTTIGSISHNPQTFQPLPNPGAIPCKFGLHCLRPGCYYSHAIKNNAPNNAYGISNNAKLIGDKKHHSERTYTLQDLDVDPDSNSDGITGIISNK